jgi:hypothetical protein
MWKIFALTAFAMGSERRQEEEVLAIERRLLGQLGDEPVLRQARPPAPGRPFLRRLAVSMRRGGPDEHSLTDYPCRLPDGTMGRVAVIPQGGDWALVCRRV